MEHQQFFAGRLFFAIIGRAYTVPLIGGVDGRGGDYDNGYVTLSLLNEVMMDRKIDRVREKTVREREREIEIERERERERER